MYCPRCGAEGEQGARYCADCGASLRTRQTATETDGPKAGRVARVVGTSRRARLLSAGTAAAVVAAIVAFIALPASSGTAGSSEGGPTLALDRLCVAETQRVAATAASELRSRGSGVVSNYASALVPIIEEWRLNLAEDAVPAGELAQVRALDSSLLDTMAHAATLARIAQGGSRQQILAQAASVDRASAEVERAVAGLGLRQCSQLRIGVGGLVHG